jgi:hypothetical protein
MLLTRHVNHGLVIVLLAGAAISLQGETPVGEAPAGSGSPVTNPHGDPSQCLACHASIEPNRVTLRFGGDTQGLCRSCHDGQVAKRQAHPAGIVPSDAIAQRMQGFPLVQGVLSCLSCHDVRDQCKGGSESSPTRSPLLRGGVDAGRLAYCLQCHDAKSYPPYNVHDQLDAGKRLKTGACAWCHVDVQAGEAPVSGIPSYPLRGDVSQICRNCHVVADNHPAGKTHLGTLLPEEMIWHISAYEIRPRMQLPMKDLMAFVRAARRAPRSIPVDERGRITCATCHNPHEEGVLPKGSDRSVGAEPKQALHHRLRAPQGQICQACHSR